MRRIKKPTGGWWKWSFSDIWSNIITPLIWEQVIVKLTDLLWNRATRKIIYWRWASSFIGDTSIWELILDIDPNYRSCGLFVGHVLWLVVSTHGLPSITLKKNRLWLLKIVFNVFKMKNMIKRCLICFGRAAFHFFFRFFFLL